MPHHLPSPPTSGASSEKWGLQEDEVTVTQEKRGRAFWISGAMEARVKSCPRSGGGEGQRGLTGDMEEATDVDRGS